MWRNLSRVARGQVISEDGSFSAELQSDGATAVVVATVLDDRPFGDFIRETTTYLAAAADSAYLLLLDADDDARCHGVFNCWTLGRNDARPHVLLRHVPLSLEGRSFLNAAA